MKILVIMKRFGANKDMVLEDFGRQIRLFENLSNSHDIDFFCPDYIKKESKIIKRKGIRYIIRPVSIFSSFLCYNSLKNLIENEMYEMIVATTDPLIGIVASKLSKKFRIPFVYDLQDNFEAYDSYKLPFVKHFDREAVKSANAVLTVSKSLKSHISKFRKGKPIHVLNNGIDLKLFKTAGKVDARKKLKLPLKSKIIVFIGHLESIKGSKILIDAFDRIRKIHPDTYLLLSGKIDDVDIMHKNIIYRKFSNREEVVLGLNAADVAALPNPVNNFTKYCFPYKLLEYMACNLPIVATDIGDVSLMLRKYKGSLCRPNDSEDLANKIILKLKENQEVVYGGIKKLSWKELSLKLYGILNSLH
jgi:teichuronic acid biosynthesis glycosyltransferase TuaC